MSVTVTQSRVATTAKHAKGLLHSRLCPWEECKRTVIVLEEPSGAVQEQKCPHFLYHELQKEVIYFVFSV